MVGGLISRCGVLSGLFEAIVFFNQLLHPAHHILALSNWKHCGHVLCHRAGQVIDHLESILPIVEVATCS